MMLRQRLVELSQSREYPFHMPGHKRGYTSTFLGDMIDKDITEITGFDDLHSPNGLIKDLEEWAARLYHAHHSFALVQGSTLGIQVSMATLCPKGSKILMQRNSHMSIYHAAMLLDLKVSYLWGSQNTDGIWLPDFVKELEESLKSDSQIRTVVVTSPDYLGIMVDIPKVIHLCKTYGCRLIIDSAHGAHLLFHKEYRWIEQGADMVVVSLHKTLPALTQTALLLTGKDISKDKVRFWIDVFETSSPSYLLLGSIEEALAFIQDYNWSAWDSRILELREKLENLNHIRLIDGEDIRYNMDKSKLVFYKRGEGMQMKAYLRSQHQLELEMALRDYCLAMTSPVDSMEGYDRLVEGMQALDRCYENQSPSYVEPIKLPPLERNTIYTMSEAKSLESMCVGLDQAEGYIAFDMVIAYPPGVPILIPGEMITRQIVVYLTQLEHQGSYIRGINQNKIKVLMKRG